MRRLLDDGTEQSVEPKYSIRDMLLNRISEVQGSQAPLRAIPESRLPSLFAEASSWPRNRPTQNDSDESGVKLNDEQLRDKKLHELLSSKMKGSCALAVALMVWVLGL